jgi:hypothetical protein
VRAVPYRPYIKLGVLNSVGLRRQRIMDQQGEVHKEIVGALK